MKKIIITIVAALALLFTGSNARAQGPMGGQFDPAQIAEMIAGQMKESLKLTNDQYTKILDIYKKQMAEMQKSFESGQMPDFEKLQAQREKQEKEINAVLTEEQAKAWAEEQKKRMEQMGGGFGGGFGGPGF